MIGLVPTHMPASFPNGVEGKGVGIKRWYALNGRQHSQHSINLQNLLRMAIYCQTLHDSSSSSHPTFDLVVHKITMNSSYMSAIAYCILMGAYINQYHQSLAEAEGIAKYGAKPIPS